MLVATGLCAVTFALIHLFIGKMAFLEVVPRSRWLSFAGGIAVPYVFLHILPELSEHQQAIVEELGSSHEMAAVWVYLVALSGLVVFYGVERVVKVSRKSISKDQVSSEILWLHIASFAAYNLRFRLLSGLLHYNAAFWPVLEQGKGCVMNGTVHTPPFSHMDSLCNYSILFISVVPGTPAIVDITKATGSAATPGRMALRSRPRYE